MALKAGIVGLPNVGKSTLFNCLSSAKAQAANFPFCTIDAQMGQITVPDERLNKLAELVHPGRIVPATCDIVDIAGLVKGASKGEGLGNQFLGNIRETDAIIHVLRCFDNDNIVHVDGSVDPVRDKEIIDTELQLKDLETIENRIKRVEKVAKVGGDKQAKLEYDVLLQYKAALEQGKSARTVAFESEDEQQAAKNLFLLTAKPVLYVCNVDDTSAAHGNAHVDAVREAIKDENAELLIISAQTEADIAELESYEEKQMFLEDMGLKESGCDRLIKAIYHLLDLQTFITAGEMEVKAWTFRKGWKAPQCAGVIHTDFEKGFIRAEVIKYDDYIRYGSKPPYAKPARWEWKEKTMWCRTATSCTSVSTYDRYGQPVIYHVESRPVRFPPRRIRRALVFAMLVLRPVGSLRIGATPVSATAHRRQTVRPVVLLLFRGHPRRRPSGALPVLRTGLLPRPPLGNDPAHAADGQRLDVHRLRRTGQPRRYDRLDACPLALRQENETEYHACTGQHCHRHSSQCHVHPSGQPDELGNHRQTDRRALGFRLRARRHAATPSRPAL